MTDSYFPADVSVRFEGNDTAGAQALLASAANLLYKALEVQRNGAKTNVRLLRPGDDGSLIQVFLAGNIKQIYIRPAPHVPQVEKSEAVTFAEESKVYINDMLSGVVRPGSGDFAAVRIISNPDGAIPPTVPVLDQFHPDQVTAAAYTLDFSWQQPQRLGIDQNGSDIADAQAISHFPKPCMYSGAMKRVVSAVLGVGRTQSYTAEYISGDVPTTFPDYVEWNQYDYTWLRTHGITKANDGSIWLVEISKLNGVLAMPLPLFDGTGENGYLEWLDSFGDTDTMAVVLEFGGLPTGEPFPESTFLADAILAGKVVVLAPPEDIADFYHDSVGVRDKAPYFADCGWAFSDSGQKAVNTMRWYSHPDVVGPPPLPGGYPYPAWATNGDAAYRYFDQVLNADGHRFDPANDRFMRTELWQVTINILVSPNATGTDPVGVGNATIVPLEQKYIAHDHDRGSFGTLTLGEMTEEGFAYQWTLPPWWFPAGDTEQLSHLIVAPFGRPAADVTQDTADWVGSAGAPVYAFFIGEIPEVVRYTPFYSGHGRLSAPGYFRGTANDLGAQGDTSGPYDSSAVFDIGLVVPAFTRETYALLKFTYPSVLGGADGDVKTVLFMAEGLLTIQSLSPHAIVLGGETAFPGLTWLYGWIGYHPVDPKPVTCAASINSGPESAYVVTDGATTTDDTQHYVQAGTLSDYAIPTDTPARGVTFVGSVSS